MPEGCGGASRNRLDRGLCGIPQRCPQSTEKSRLKKPLSQAYRIATIMAADIPAINKSSTSVTFDMGRLNTVPRHAH